MSHAVGEKTKLLTRVRRILRQVGAIGRALEAEVACADILQLIASVRSAIDGLVAETIEDHIRWCAPSRAAQELRRGRGRSDRDRPLLFEMNPPAVR